ncbi:hypothetical protein BRD18_06790 [Halobacteriales archaeon SW_7_71_33]|nr:MAG: hypothetical protein BRD18_06790 [Halobacteriales archaeon SW_7_71_33]
MLDDEGPADVVDVVDVARAVVREFDEKHPVATVALDPPDATWTDDATAADDKPATVRVDAGGDLGLALAHLVENGVEHGGDEPTVTVQVRREDGDVVVRVTDDGPGIPPYERAVVAGDREPTQLDHGSGLGLWIIRWVVEGYGGTVAFETPADDSRGRRSRGGDAAESDAGTTVVLRLSSV